MTAIYVTEIVFQMRTDMFKTGKSLFGIDLMALDTKRIYDHGLQSYTTYLHYCGLGRVKTWKDLEQFMPRQVETRFHFNAFVAEIYHNLLVPGSGEAATIVQKRK
jgi:hypothetical protein